MSGLVKGIQFNSNYRIFKIYGPINNTNEIQLWTKLESRLGVVDYSMTPFDWSNDNVFS